MESQNFDPSSFPPPNLNSIPNQSVSNQIFGNFSPENSLLAPAIPQDFLYDGTEDFNFDPTTDSLDSKRRRIARACDACRKKKIKCDGKVPACSHCQNYKTECVFTHVEKKRSPPKGAKYIEGLENRLGRMEALLKMSGLLNREDEKGTDLGMLEQRLARQQHSPSIASGHSRATSTTHDTLHATSPRQDRSQSPFSGIASPEEPKPDPDRKDSEQDVEALSELMCSLVTNNQGETRYIGSSSGFSIFSPRGIEWVGQKTGDHSFKNMIEEIAQDDNKWQCWRPEVFDDIFQYQVYQPLPSREECHSLLRIYFVGLNKIFPLFHEPTFLWLVDKQYTDDPYRGTGWWASLNVALALAYRIQVVKNVGRGDEESKGWAYFKNALAVHSQLTLRNTDLLSVQALIGMSLFMQGTPNPQPSFQLASSAIRLSHEVGLHKKGSGFGLNNTELEQRKRVFWIAYMIDKDICLRSGRPPAQDDDDWNVGLPSEEPEDGVGLITCADGKTKINLFRQFCKFAVIEGRVYNRLYSVKASKQSDGELLNTIGELDLELEAWKDEIPLEFRPECEIKTTDESLLMQVVTLHFAYYNVMATIHRMAIHHGVWTDRLSEYAIKGLNVKPLNPRVYCSAALCVSAARASINLIKYIPPGDYALVWMILYYPVSSLVTLFANTLQNPQDPRARADLKLIQIVVTFLAQLAEDDDSGSIKRPYAVCKEFHRIANVVVEKAEKEMTARQKRKQEREREKVEKNLKQPELPLKKSSQQMNHKRPADDMLNQVNNTDALSNSATISPGLNFGDTVSQQSNFSPDISQDSIDSTSFNTSWMQTNGSSPNVGFGNSNINENHINDPSLGIDHSSTSQSTPLNLGSFQQPFLPQDLWNMPMTFEWDLALFDDPHKGAGQGQSFHPHRQF